MDGSHKERKKCDFCSKTFINNSSLNRHVKALHLLKPKLYRCLLCDKEFFKANNSKDTSRYMKKEKNCINVIYVTKHIKEMTH